MFLLLVSKYSFSKIHFSLSSITLFVFPTICDDSGSLPEKLRLHLPIRLALGLWYFATVVVVNAYIGLVICSLITPFQLTSI